MSRRRRKRTVAPADQVKAETSVAKDGFVNTLAYLGEASELTKANDYERHSISTDYDTLTILYRENWLAARIIDTPCEDMTRAWYSLSSEIDQERLDEFAKLEAKHSIKQEITNAIRWGRLYGGAAAVMVIKGQEDMLEEPLDYDMIQPGCFRGLIVIDKVRGIFPSIELEEDMDDVEFGYPKYYEVILDEEKSTIVRIHHSRLLLFRGRQLPIDEEIAADYWGASEIEHIYEELQKRNATSANIAQLIFQANVAALKISDYGEVLGMGTEAQRKQLYKTIYEMNRIRTSFGMALMGTEDSYEQHPYSFAGVSEVYETFMMDMAGAAEIPATKLFGRAPQGMNSTGESDMKNYYEMINQLQERILKPALEKLVPVMAMSLWGEVPDDLEIVFEPLGTTTPAERSQIASQIAGPIVQAYSAGLITQRMGLMELRETGKPIGVWTNITDEDIENASNEFDQGEAMDPMSAMMGGGGAEMQGAPQGGPDMPPEMAQAGLESPEETQAGPEQPEVDMDKVHELKERVHNMRTQAEPEEDDQENQAELESIPERAGKLKSRLNHYRENKARREKIEELRGRIEQIRERAESEEAEDAVEPSAEGTYAPGEAQSDPNFESQHPRGPGGQFTSKQGGSSPVKAPKSLTGSAPSVAPQSKRPVSAKSQKWNVEHGFPATASVAGQKGVKAWNTRPSLRKPAANNAQKMAELRKRIDAIRAKSTEDGGPGSGPRPGYHKNGTPGLMARAQFIANPTQGMPEPKRTPRTAQNVAKQNKERAEWSNLSLHQKVAGNAAQERAIRKVKAQVAQMAAKGDIEGAKKIVQKNRHYWANDPDSAQKVQSETLQKQKAARKGFLHDVLSFFRKQMEDGGEGSGNFGHAGRPGKRGGSAPSGEGQSYAGATAGEGTGSAKMREGSGYGSNEGSSKPGRKYEKLIYSGPFGPDLSYSSTNPAVNGEYRETKNPLNAKEKRRQAYEYEVKHGNSIDPYNTARSMPRTIGTLLRYKYDDRRSPQEIEDAKNLATDMFWALSGKDRREFVERGMQVMEKWDGKDTPYEYRDFVQDLREEAAALNGFDNLKEEFGEIDPKEIEPFYGDEEFDEEMGYFRAQMEGLREEVDRANGNKKQAAPIDNGTQEAYNGSTPNMVVSDANIEVKGPAGTADWARQYVLKHPEVRKEAEAYRDVLRNVKTFSQKHPDLKNVTCDAVTGEVIPTDKLPGYCVTFHQNKGEHDPFGGYNDWEYALMCAIAKRELGANSVNIGVYGNPEVSFSCTDLQKASDFAVKHNQESIFDPATETLLFNGKYDPKYNPIKKGG